MPQSELKYEALQLEPPLCEVAKPLSEQLVLVNQVCRLLNRAKAWTLEQHPYHQLRNIIRSKFVNTASEAILCDMVQYYWFQSQENEHRHTRFDAIVIVRQKRDVARLTVTTSAIETPDLKLPSSNGESDFPDHNLQDSSESESSDSNCSCDTDSGDDEDAANPPLDPDVPLEDANFTYTQKPSSSGPGDDAVFIFGSS